MSRAAVAITLSEAERRELEGLAPQRKTAQGLARRARIVLAAADGLENKAIVERVGADANTVGKWRRRFAERRLDGLHDEPRSGAPRKIGDEKDRGDHRPHPGRDAARRHALEPALDGPRLRLCAFDHSPDLASLRLAAASLRDLQAVIGPAVCGEGAGHRRALSEPSGTGARAVRRREEPDPGAGSHSSASSHAARTDRAAHP